MQELITITADEQGSLAVNTLDFASGLGIQHKNLLETIRTHQDAIERDFGVIAFETRKPDNSMGEGRPVTFANLSEDQALFVGTLSRNSKRVVAFKSVLIRSFAEARKRLQPEQSPHLLPSTEQILLQLAQQQTQLLTTQQEQLNQLRADVKNLMGGQRPANTSSRPRPGQQLAVPGLPGPTKSGPGVGGFRQLIARKVNDYCGYHGAEPGETYNYLYKRLYDVYGVNVYRLKRYGKESFIDALERYGYLDRLYSLVMAELHYEEL